MLPGSLSQDERQNEQGLKQITVGQEVKIDTRRLKRTTPL